MPCSARCSCEPSDGSCRRSRSGSPTRSRTRRTSTSSAAGTRRRSTSPSTRVALPSGCCSSCSYNQSVPELKSFDDRQLDAVLERLDGLRTELERLNSRLDHTEGFLAVAHELRTLNESLQALAYAALGQQGPQVRRRRTG